MWKVVFHRGTVVYYSNYFNYSGYCHYSCLLLMITNSLHIITNSFTIIIVNFQCSRSFLAHTYSVLYYAFSFLNRLVFASNIVFL